MQNREKLLRKCQRMQRSFYDLAAGRGRRRAAVARHKYEKNLFKEGREKIEVDLRLKRPVWVKRLYNKELVNSSAVSLTHRFMCSGSQLVCDCPRPTSEPQTAALPHPPLPQRRKKSHFEIKEYGRFPPDTASVLFSHGTRGPQLF